MVHIPIVQTMCQHGHPSNIKGLGDTWYAKIAGWVLYRGPVEVIDEPVITGT